LFEDEELFEQLFAAEEVINPQHHSKKRVRIEDLEEDEVRLVGSPKKVIAETQTEPQRRKARTKKPKDENAGPSASNMAASQLMREAKISLTVAQICDLAPGFRAEMRRLLIKPKKQKVSENLLIQNEDEVSGNCPRTHVIINNKLQVNTLLDGGAVPNIISLDLVKKLGIKELHSSQYKYTTANGQKSMALGLVPNLEISLKGRTIRCAAIVYNQTEFPLLLGRRVLKRLKVSTNWETCSWSMRFGDTIKTLPINFNSSYDVISVQNEQDTSPSEDDEFSSSEVSEVSGESDHNEILVMITNEIEESQNGNLKILPGTSEIVPDKRSDDEKIQEAIINAVKGVNHEFESFQPELKSLLLKYQDIFAVSYKGLSHTNIIEFDIDTKDAKPTYIKSRPLPYQYKEFVKKELYSAVEAGTMDGPLKRLCQWGSPVWVVVKPKTNELRMVGDFRILNSKTVSDEFAIPDLQETIESLEGSVVFSPLDLLKAFNQIFASLRARERLVLATEFGNFAYKVMPFGPKNAPATFAKAICIMSAEVSEFVAAYFDDLTVHSSDANLHLSHLEKMFSVIRKYNFKLRPDKCQFFQTEIELLGHIVSASGIKPAPKLLDKIALSKVPENKTDIKSFIHLCGFFQQHVQNFADIAAPLTEMLKRNIKFKWDTIQQEAWTILKEQTLNAIELAFYKANKITNLYSDASDIGIGGVLTQLDKDKKERIVKCLSRKLTETERKYDTVSKELLAINYCLQKLRKYLLGINFNLYTDSNAVKWLFTKREITAKHGRYIMLLQDYPCTVIHLPGRSNVVADILSRYPPNKAPTHIDHFDHILMMEEASPGYEKLYNLVFQYIITMDLNLIPSDLQRRVLTERSKFFIEEGVLYRRSSYGPLIVPKILDRSKVLGELHEGHGHFGQESTWRRARIQYWWPAMYQDIKEKIKTCHPCQITNQLNPKRMSLWPIQTDQIFQRFGLDYVGPMIETPSGNKYILTITEYYTRWPIAVATKTADAQTTADILYNQIFCVFGPPAEILSDRGSHFRNEIIKNLCETVGVKHKFSTPYHPQTNGLVEHFNGVLVQILRKLCFKHPFEWDQHIGTALYGYRTKIHQVMEISPYEMLYGVKPFKMDPIQFAAQTLGAERLSALDDMRIKANDKLSAYQSKRFTPGLSFNKGDLVLIKRSKNALKLESKWLEKPYMIYRVHDNNTYDLIDHEGNLWKSRLNALRLKKFNTKENLSN
jgi:hypothetical protein